jgi:preprotein translocase subunit SecG
VLVLVILIVLVVVVVLVLLARKAIDDEGRRLGKDEHD